MSNIAEHPSLEVDAVKELMGDRIMIAWQEAQDEIKVGKTTLVRPDTHKKAHYTGEVLMIGLDVESQEIREQFAEAKKKGKRIRLLFDQFSNFEKFYDPKYGRIAVIREHDQGSAFAIIPARVKIGGGEGDFNYDL